MVSESVEKGWAREFGEFNQPHIKESRAEQSFGERIKGAGEVYVEKHLTLSLSFPPHVSIQNAISHGLGDLAQEKGSTFLSCYSPICLSYLLSK